MKYTSTMLPTLFVVALMALSASAELNLRGVSPEVRRAHFPDPNVDTFKCADGSGQSLPASAFNDDYCDCADGSDEPGTSACANGRFYCANKKHTPSLIFSSRVNDGICDCCDGTDEWASGACQDTCLEAGREAREKLEMEILRFQEGLAVKAEYRREAESKIEFWQGEVEAKRAEHADHKKLVDELESDKVKAEAAEEEENSRRRAEHDAKEVPEGEEKAAYEKYETPEAKEARENYSIQKPILDKLDREITKLQEDIDRDFGPDKVWGGVYGECFEKQDKEYTYKWCPLDEVQQSGTSLGHFKGFDGDNYNVMIFDGGASCWQGPNRNTRLEITCGPANEILSINEPSRCVYHMTATSPAACSQEHIDAMMLEASGDGGHDEL